MQLNLEPDTVQLGITVGASVGAGILGWFAAQWRKTKLRIKEEVAIEPNMLDAVTAATDKILSFMTKELDNTRKEVNVLREYQVKCHLDIRILQERVLEQDNYIDEMDRYVDALTNIMLENKLSVPLPRPKFKKKPVIVHVSK